MNGKAHFIQPGVPGRTSGPIIICWEHLTLYPNNSTSRDLTQENNQRISNKVLLYSTGNYIQHPVTNYYGKEYEEECIYTCNWIIVLYSRNQHNTGNQLCGGKSLSRVQLFATLWTVAHQAPLSMGFSRQGYWSGLPHPPPGDLPNPGIEPESVMSPALAGGFLNASTTWEAPKSTIL